MHRAELPASLGDAFSVSSARSHGVTASRLRAQDLERPFHGVRVRAGATSGEGMLLARARQYVERMSEHEFFSHVVAAELWGIPLPPELVAERLLDVSVLWPRRAPASAGVQGHSLRTELVRTRPHPATGWTVSSPASTWAMMAAIYPSVADAVAAADALVREPLHRSDPAPLTTLDQLAKAAAAGRRRGRAVLDAALPLVRTRSQSRPETILRLMIMAAGLPEPVANLDVYAGPAWIARVDLAFIEERVALEYEGLHHLTDGRRWAEDIRRRERLADAGWRVVQVTHSDLFVAPELLLARIRRALGR